MRQGVGGPQFPAKWCTWFFGRLVLAKSLVEPRSIMGDWTGCLHSGCLRKRKAGSKTLGRSVGLFIAFVVFNRTSGFCTFPAAPSAKLLSGPSVSLHIYDCSNKAKHELRCAGCLNFSLPSRRFFCFPLDSAALSDSWRALILIIPLHQCVFLYFFPLFLCFCFSCFWCNPLVAWLFSARSLALPQRQTTSSSACLDTAEPFPGLHVCQTTLFLACLQRALQGSTELPTSRCLMEWGSIRRAAQAHPGRWLMAPRWSRGQDSG